MKKTYIIPSILCVKIGTQRPLMQMSRNNKEINSANAGLVKEDISGGNSGYNVWDDDWSNN